MSVSQTTMTTAANFHEFQFSFHGQGLRYKTSSRTLLSSVAAWAHEFRQAELSGEVSLTIQFEEVSSRDAVPMVKSPSSRLLFSGTMPAIGSSMRALWQCEVIQDDDDGRLVVDVHERAVLVIQPDRGTAHGYFLRPETMHPDLLESFFHFALVELLKRQNMFTLRATALEYHGRGLLIPGYSGCGKTTTLLSLLRSGYRYLSDDHPILRDAGTRLELLAVPMKIDVTDQTIALFPELREAMSGLLHQGVYKKSFSVEDLFANPLGHSCEPAMIVFPYLTNMPHSCLEPIPKSQALEMLLPNPSFISDEQMARQELQTLSKLVQQTACYLLHFGQDVLDLPQLISPLLERH
jgi:hypothetical protein